LRDLIRDFLAAEAAGKEQGTVVGTITIIYDHDVADVQDYLTELQHDAAGLVLATLHVHLSSHRCLEVIAVKGPARRVRTLADSLIASRGVKHGKLAVVAAGKDLP